MQMGIPDFSKVKRLFGMVIALGLSGCAGLAIETVNVVADKARLQSALEEAEAGDPKAQFVVGDSLCCSGNDPERGAYSTEKAIGWLCASADQGNSDAMMKLGKIFSGDQTDGVRVMRRLVNAASGTPSNFGAAYFWYTRAAEAGNEDGAAAAIDLQQEKMSQDDKLLATGYLTEALAKPCDWESLAPEAS
jgi:hypothetical protein